jgi:hypothetical protein
MEYRGLKFDFSAEENQQIRLVYGLDTEALFKRAIDNYFDKQSVVFSPLYVNVETSIDRENVITLNITNVYDN